MSKEANTSTAPSPEIVKFVNTIADKPKLFSSVLKAASAKQQKNNSFAAGYHTLKALANVPVLSGLSMRKYKNTSELLDNGLLVALKEIPKDKVERIFEEILATLANEDGTIDFNKAKAIGDYLFSSKKNEAKSPENSQKPSIKPVFRKSELMSYVSDIHNLITNLDNAHVQKLSSIIAKRLVLKVEEDTTQNDIDVVSALVDAATEKTVNALIEFAGKFIDVIESHPELNLEDKLKKQGTNLKELRVIFSSSQDVIKAALKEPETLKKLFTHFYSGSKGQISDDVKTMMDKLREPLQKMLSSPDVLEVLAKNDAVKSLMDLPIIQTAMKNPDLRENLIQTGKELLSEHHTDIKPLLDSYTKYAEYQQDPAKANESEIILGLLNHGLRFLSKVNIAGLKIVQDQKALKSAIDSSSMEFSEKKTALKTLDFYHNIVQDSKFKTQYDKAIENIQNVVAQHPTEVADITKELLRGDPEKILARKALALLSAMKSEAAALINPENFELTAEKILPLFKDPAMCDAVNHDLEKVKDIIVPALDLMLRANDEEGQLSKYGINGDFSFELLKRVNTPKGIEAIQRYMDAPGPMNSLRVLIDSESLMFVASHLMSSYMGFKRKQNVEVEPRPIIKHVKTKVPKPVISEKQLKEAKSHLRKVSKKNVELPAEAAKQGELSHEGVKTTRASKLFNYLTRNNPRDRQ